MNGPLRQVSVEFNAEDTDENEADTKASSNVDIDAIITGIDGIFFLWFLMGCKPFFLCVCVKNNYIGIFCLFWSRLKNTDENEAIG